MCAWIYPRGLEGKNCLVKTLQWPYRMILIYNSLILHYLRNLNLCSRGILGGSSGASGLLQRAHVLVMKIAFFWLFLKEIDIYRLRSLLIVSVRLDWGTSECYQNRVR